MFKTNNEIQRNVVMIRLFNSVTVQTTYIKNFLDDGILLNFFLERHFSLFSAPVAAY